MAAASRKHVVITGVTRGLGLALAERLIRLGHVVLGCGRTRAAVEELRKAHRTPHDFAAVDVADEGEVKRWAERLLGAYPAPDLLVNNAALINPNAPLWEIVGEEFGRVI